MVRLSSITALSAKVTGGYKLKPAAAAPKASTSDEPVSGSGSAGSSDSAFDPEWFLAYFERNWARPRPLPVTPSDGWAGLAPAQQVALTDLVNKVAFGEATEGKMGRRLSNLASHPADKAALEFYVKEEERHAQELFYLSDVFGLGLDPSRPGLKGRLISLLAALFNLGSIDDTSNLILVGEVLTLTFYREIKQAQTAKAPLVAALIGHIIRDEAGHLNFHAARLQASVAGAGKVGHWRAKAVHQFGLFVTLLAVTLTSKSICELSGLSRKQLFRQLEQDYNRFYQRPQLTFLRTRRNRLFRLFGGSSS
jgi:hypothetical protein